MRPEQNRRVYFAHPEEDFVRPAPAYVDTMLAGAREHGLPTAYLTTRAGG